MTSVAAADHYVHLRLLSNSAPATAAQGPTTSAPPMENFHVLNMHFLSVIPEWPERWNQNTLMINLAKWISYTGKPCRILVDRCFIQVGCYVVASDASLAGYANASLSSCNDSSSGAD